MDCVSLSHGSELLKIILCVFKSRTSLSDDAMPFVLYTYCSLVIDSLGLVSLKGGLKCFLQV